MAQVDILPRLEEGVGAYVSARATVSGHTHGAETKLRSAQGHLMNKTFELFEKAFSGDEEKRHKRALLFLEEVELSNHNCQFSFFHLMGLGDHRDVPLLFWFNDPNDLNDRNVNDRDVDR